MEEEPSIQLNETEIMVFDLLKKTINHYELSTTIRVVGGWVRDKLLGKESHDIDITVDNMSPSQFSEFLQKYVNENTKHHVSGIGLIQKNPSAGKHLETATLRIDSISIDVCCLRSDDYCETNTQKIGTPLEDAQRRDFTINSMFYRVNDNTIEDLTGLGLTDLKNGVIRTPIPPKETLHDDPARALRAIRFSSKMGFILDEELEGEMATKYIIDKVSNGISRERVGRELIGMIQTGKAAYCVDKIRSCGYFKGMFGNYNEEETLGIVRSYEKYSEMFDAFDIGKREIGVLAAITQLVSQEIEESKKKISRVQDIVMNYLKLSVKEKNCIVLIHNGVQELKKLLNKMDWERVELGRFIISSEEWWKQSICLCCAVEAPSDGILVCPKDEIVMNERMLEWGRKLVNKIEEQQLGDVWKLKPIVNGEECSKILQRKGGAWLRDVLRDVIELQIQKPTIERDEVIEFVSKWKK